MSNTFILFFYKTPAGLAVTLLLPQYDDQSEQSRARLQQQTRQ